MEPTRFQLGSSFSGARMQFAALHGWRCAPGRQRRLERLSTAAGYCHHCQQPVPVGITTQVPQLETRLDPEEGATRLRNYLNVMNMELVTLARACGNPTSIIFERETSPRLLSRRRRCKDQVGQYQLDTRPQSAPALLKRSEKPWQRKTMSSREIWQALVAQWQ